MKIFFGIFSLLIALTSASLEHIGYYGYHGPPAPLSKDGRVVETPEVAHARAAHLAAYAAAASATDARLDLERDELVSKDTSVIITGANEPQTKVYDGPPAPLGEDGRVIDTTEVARVKAAHLAAHAEALKNTETTNGEATIVWKDEADANHLVVVPSHVAYTISHKTSVYRGPSAPLAPDGAVVDTREVAEAKAAHLRAHAATLANIQHISDNNCHC